MTKIKPIHSAMVGRIAVLLHTKFSTSGKDFMSETDQDKEVWIKHGLDVALEAGNAVETYRKRGPNG